MQDTFSGWSWEDLNRLIKPGKILLIDDGEHEEYRVLGVFVVIKESYQLRVAKEFLSNLLDKYGKIREWIDMERNRDVFITYLLDKGYLSKVDYATLTFRGYWKLESISFNPGS